MRRRSKARSWLGICALLPLAVSAANEGELTPVTWKVQHLPASVAAAQPYALQLHADIAPGWHLYALNEPPGGPIATEVGLAEGDPSDLISINEDPSIEQNDPVFGHLLRFHLKQAQFSLQLRAPATLQPGPLVVHLLARYQACSDKLCLPPKTIAVEAKLPTKAAASSPRS